MLHDELVLALLRLRIVGRGSLCWFRHARLWVEDRRVGFAVLAVLDCGSWIANSWVVLCGAGLWVAVVDGVIWCWVAGAGFGDGETKTRDER